MQLSLDETFLAYDHHTYMKRQTQAAKLELPPHILDLRKWDGVTTGDMRDSASSAPVICSSSSSFGFEGFDLDRFAESAPHAQL